MALYHSRSSQLWLLCQLLMSLTAGLLTCLLLENLCFCTSQAPNLCFLQASVSLPQLPCSMPVISA